MSRRLTDDERELWHRVARTARRRHPEQFPEVTPPPAPDPRPRVASPPRQDTFVMPASAPRPATATVRFDLATPISEKLAKAPVRMDRGLHRAMTRGKLEPEARIDLHGMTVAQAHSVLTGFILSSQARGLRLVLVITGKGRGSAEAPAPMSVRQGVLKHEVPQWLAMPPLGPLVLELREAHRTQGGSGAYYVYLKKRRQGAG